MHLWHCTCIASYSYNTGWASSFISTWLPLPGSHAAVQLHLHLACLWNSTCTSPTHLPTHMPKEFLSELTRLRNLNRCITNSCCLFETFPDEQFRWPSNVILVNQKCKHLGSGLCWMDLKMSYGRNPARSLSLVWQSPLLPGTCFSRLNTIPCNMSKTSITPSLSGLQLQNASHVQHFMKLLFLAQSIFLLL